LAWLIPVPFWKTEKGLCAKSRFSAFRLPFDFGFRMAKPCHKSTFGKIPKFKLGRHQLFQKLDAARCRGACAKHLAKRTGGWHNRLYIFQMLDVVRKALKESGL
jgi:hypothetical protein